MSYKVDHVNWQVNADEIRLIREKVFVCEYRLPQDSEFDNIDRNCEHVLIRDNENTAIATGRICANGKISRIAVLMKHRKHDVSSQVISKLLAIAKNKGLKKVYIDSELDDVEKYRKYGFNAISNVFMDAGIAKQALACPLDKFKSHNTILH
ncbi:GNAT family N-acetyltransferase [Psychrosphaera aquimarina]|uniref:GNAT family N-acetyltransferase n=1 Tax=Psychrosphaera aquimarina TaxID=2044854 RepID=A0ABU3R547_9GAMM|nr:GNAT family N-acetyltransferase [Psychrosphaera aquimarina]MDU0114814.1 GNAT family N-acetyltransferase [Psychrosphaera aquimarina]